MNSFDAVVGAGSLRSRAPGAVPFPHRWTDAGVTVESDFTGAHLLHLAVAGCVLNDVYREAATLGVELDGVRVSAGGDFDRTSWQSTGVSYEVELDSPAPADALDRLLAVVDDVAEIPKAVRAGTSVKRVVRPS